MHLVDHARAYYRENYKRRLVTGCCAGVLARILPYRCVSCGRCWGPRWDDPLPVLMLMRDCAPMLEMARRRFRRSAAMTTRQTFAAAKGQSGNAWPDDRLCPNAR